MITALALFIGEGQAQQSVSSSLGVIVYPAKGQSLEKQNMDEGECYAWAQQQTGINPMAVASSPPANTNSEPGGKRIKGAAGGALAGAAIGGIAGDAGKGAGIGAVVGTLRGGRQSRLDKAAQEQQAEQAKTSTLQHFNKAFGTCMEGREYTVK
jgi:hypothetical protein